jgi:hypothetical protein
VTPARRTPSIMVMLEDGGDLGFAVRQFLARDGAEFAAPPQLPGSGMFSASLNDIRRRLH